MASERGSPCSGVIKAQATTARQVHSCQHRNGNPATPCPPGPWSPKPREAQVAARKHSPGALRAAGGDVSTTRGVTAAGKRPRQCGRSLQRGRMAGHAAPGAKQTPSRDARSLVPGPCAGTQNRKPRQGASGGGAGRTRPGQGANPRQTLNPLSHRGAPGPSPPRGKAAVPWRAPATAGASGRGADLVVVDQLLLHHLHGVHLVALLQPHQQNLGVAAAPDDPDQVEVLQPEPLRDLDSVHPVDDRLEVLREDKTGAGTGHAWDRGTRSVRVPESWALGPLRPPAWTPGLRPLTTGLETGKPSQPQRGASAPWTAKEVTTGSHPQGHLALPGRSAEGRWLTSGKASQSNCPRNSTQ